MKARGVRLGSMLFAMALFAGAEVATSDTGSTGVTGATGGPTVR